MRPPRTAAGRPGACRRLMPRAYVPVGAVASAVAGALLAVGAAATAGIAGASTTTVPPATTNTVSAQTQAALLASLNAALTAAAAQKSVHYVQQASAGGQKVTIVGDASSAEGQQAVTVRNGSSVGHVTGELTGGKVYFKGDAYGLTSYLGMPSALASKYKNRWIVFTKSDQGFTQSAKAFTLQGTLSVVKLTKGTLSPAAGITIGSVAATGIEGRTTALSSSGKTGIGTLYLASSGPPLPVRFVGSGTQSAGAAKGEVDFSLWGERVAVPIPSRAIAASKIQ